MSSLMLLLLIIYPLSVARLTRLINWDTIMDWLHTWAARRFGPHSRTVEFLQCPWCVGMWVALLTAWVIPPLFFPAFNWMQQIVIGLGFALYASLVTGLLAGLWAEDDDFEELPKIDLPPKE